MNIKQTNSNVAKEILNKCGQKPCFLKQDQNERVAQLHKLSTSWDDNQRDFWNISCPADITFHKTFLKKVWNISRKLRYVLKTHERDWNLQPKMSPRKWPRILQWKKSMRVAQIMGKSKSWRDLCLTLKTELMHYCFMYETEMTEQLDLFTLHKISNKEYHQNLIVLLSGENLIFFRGTVTDIPIIKDVIEVITENEW